VTKQLFFQPRAIGITSAILFFMGLMPGLPAIPFWMLASLTGGVAFAVSRKNRIESQKEKEEHQRSIETAAAETSMEQTRQTPSATPKVLPIVSLLATFFASLVMPAPAARPRPLSAPAFS